MASVFVRKIDDLKNKLKDKARRPRSGEGCPGGDPIARVTSISRVSWHAEQAFDRSDLSGSYESSGDDSVLFFEKGAKFAIDKNSNSDGWCWGVNLANDEAGWVRFDLLARSRHKLEGMDSGSKDSGNSSAPSNLNSFSSGPAAAAAAAATTEINSWDMLSYPPHSRDVELVLRGQSEGTFVICQESVGNFCMVVIMPSSSAANQDDLVFYDVNMTVDNQFLLKDFSHRKPSESIKQLAQDCCQGRYNKDLKIKLRPPEVEDDSDDDDDDDDDD